MNKADFKNKMNGLLDRAGQVKEELVLLRQQPGANKESLLQTEAILLLSETISNSALFNHEKLEKESDYDKAISKRKTAGSGWGK